MAFVYVYWDNFDKGTYKDRNIENSSTNKD